VADEAWRATKGSIKRKEQRPIRCSRLGHWRKSPTKEGLAYKDTTHRMHIFLTFRI
jgi:hypothetical protein